MGSGYFSIYCLNLLFVVFQLSLIIIFFLLRLIILIVNVIYILELYLRIFFESVPKINFSRTELVFQPGFWKYCQPKVTQIIFGLAFQVHGQCGFWSSNYKKLCDKLHWRHLLLFFSLYFFLFSHKAKAEKDGISMTLF